MAAHEQHEGAAQVESEQWHRDGGDDAPDDQGVPLPLPDVVDEAQGMMAEMLELLAVHGQAAGVEEVDAQLDERKNQEQVEWRHGMHANLGGDLVETEGPGEHDDDEGGEAYGWIDADDHAEGEAPGETPGSDAAAHLAEQRAQHPAATELTYGAGNEHTEV